MEPIRRVAVVGLGLIGGSIARALAARGVRVAGYDSNAEHLDAAIAENVVTERLSPSLKEVTGADAVVIAVYGDQAAEILKTLQPFADDVRLVTDVGSTKQVIVDAAERLKLAPRFVGSHPFAGDHRSGWSASRADLFENQTVYVCRTSKTETATLDLAESLWKLLGANPVELEAPAHDRLLALTSHLAHVVSTALALALADSGITPNQLGRGGRDVTRLAAGSREVWTSILSENAEAVEAGIGAVQARLDQFRDAMRSGNRETLGQLIREGNEWSLTKQKN